MDPAVKHSFLNPKRLEDQRPGRLVDQKGQKTEKVSRPGRYPARMDLYTARMDLYPARIVFYSDGRLVG
ncbi:DUF221 family protein [Sesbania bispinosa]|nr:DUF221 family protein [Sesbania bispinosa]